MTSEIKHAVIISAAMILFLSAASTLPGLTWRANPAVQIAVASR
jgi:hypothetical protein